MAITPPPLRARHDPPAARTGCRTAHTAFAGPVRRAAGRAGEVDVAAADGRPVVASDGASLGDRCGDGPGGEVGGMTRPGGIAMTACEWCGSAFEAVKRGDRAKRFCSDSCRAGFHSAARRWVQNAIAEGRLTIDELRAGISSPCTAESEGSTTIPAPDPGNRLPRARATCTLTTDSPQGPRTDAAPVHHLRPFGPCRDRRGAGRAAAVSVHSATARRLEGCVHPSNC